MSYVIQTGKIHVQVLSDPLPIKTVFAQHAYITTPYLNCKELSNNSSWDIEPFFDKNQGILIYLAQAKNVSVGSFFECTFTKMAPLKTNKTKKSTTLFPSIFHH